jgi:hypothetical protein
MPKSMAISALSRYVGIEPAFAKPAARQAAG